MCVYLERQQLAQVAWLAERLVAQIAAINRETATWSLRAWDSASPTLSRWQRRRLQHQEYDVDLLCSQLTKLADVAGIQVLHQQQKEKLQFISALSAM